MSEQYKGFSVKQMLWSLCFVVFCAGVSFSFSHMFPQAERWFADSQLRSQSLKFPASSIVMIGAGEQSAAFCGKGRWNVEVLQSTMVALNQAGASIIAPMVDLSLPVTSECGGLSGLVQLAEVTKQVGSVVYPDSVPSALKQAAIQTGHLELPFDAKEHFGGFTVYASSLSFPKVPFGIAVVSSIKTHVAQYPTDSFLYIPRTVSKQEEVGFSRSQFTDVFRLIQDGKRNELSRLFKGKIVFLYSDSSRSLHSPGAKISDHPIALLHAKLAQAYWNNSWVVPAPFLFSFLLAVSLGCVMVVLMRSKFSWFHVLCVAVLLLVSVLFLLEFQRGWLWPLFSMGFAVGMTIIGMSAWNMWVSRATVHQRIAFREQKLTKLEHDLSEKENHARELEAQLSQAQYQFRQSGSVIQELEIAQHTSLSQLKKYQGEIQETRRQIEFLQGELEDLRQYAPANLKEGSSEVGNVDDQEMIQECQTFHIVTRDSAVLRLFANLKKAAATQVPILFLGETGTGKEVFAKAAHALSPRRHGPFISVNMAAIRSELFEGELFGHVKGAFTGAVGRTGFLESAHGGTLFLDEVGDLPFDLQAKLLRFLEDGGFHRVGQSAVTHVDVRIVAATNRDLQDEVRAGRYREDLYYRLRSVVLTLPPLRDRSQADHVLLADLFLQNSAQGQHRSGLAFSQGALDAIVAYQWPGNIRELRQTIAQAVALANGSVITEAELQLEEARTSGVQGNIVKNDLGQREDAMVLECLRRHQFEMQATAETLGWDRGTVTQRLKGLGFQALMDYQGDIHAAAVALAGDERFVRVVEGRLREYTKNLVPSSKQYGSVEEAIADCRKRFRNLPERHFPAVEQLLHERFAAL